MYINQDLVKKHYGSTACFDAIHYFRHIALVIDQNPAAMDHYLINPYISALAFDRNSSCLARTQYLEALSYGDAGVLLACPGPSLSGLLLRELGSKEQQEYFFDYVESNKASTFFAVTEPNFGSDPTSMQTVAVQGNQKHYLLSGEKWLVGHGADAPIGVVLARIARGPLGMVAFLLTEEVLNNAKTQLERKHLNMVGLRGARLSQIAFHQLQLSKHHFLGFHLRPVERGMMALLKTFNRMRPGVAAFALGTAQAILDYLLEASIRLEKYKPQFNILSLKINLTRQFLYQAAAKIDQNPFESGHISLAKVKASRLAEQCAAFAYEVIGSEGLMEHPLLRKWLRDVYGYEYMEGTTLIQRKNIFNLYVRNK